MRRSPGTIHLGGWLPDSRCTLLPPPPHTHPPFLFSCLCVVFFLPCNRLRIDDPVDAAPVHFFCGMWGIIATGFFATEVRLAA